MPAASTHSRRAIAHPGPSGSHAAGPGFGTRTTQRAGLPSMWIIVIRALMAMHGLRRFSRLVTTFG
jgi:hypothetical protein